MADPVPQLEYHRRGIYLGLLCPFLPLGSDGVGSLALSETQSGFFLMLLQAIARLEEDTYNRYLIPQWCAWNWPGVSEGSLPRVAVGRLDRRNVAQWFEAVVQAVQSGAIVVGDELRAQAEDLLGIERAEVEDEVQTGGASPGETEPDEDNAVDASAPVKMAEAERPSAIAIRALGIEVKFDVLASTMDEREQRLVQKLTALQRSQAKRLVAIGNKAVKAGDATVLESTVIETAREAEELLAEMGGAFDDAAEEYMRQIVSQGAKALKPVDKADRVALLAIVAALVYACAEKVS
jgi:hypothetical protein